jgi:radical SAM-linked protein
MKIRMLFSKNLKYISHLDLMKTMQKTLKRSGLRLKYSEGFNPHIVLSIANPLPVGAKGEREYADFEILDDNLNENEVLDKLVAASPEGLKPLEICFAGENVKGFRSFNDTEFAEYKIEIETGYADDVKGIINLLEKDEILTEKKSKSGIKTVNLKDFIHKLEFESLKDFSSRICERESPNVANIENGLLLNLICACGNNKNLNPFLIKKVIAAHGFDVITFDVTRCGCYDENFNIM